jgi:hypothetical protein
MANPTSNNAVSRGSAPRLTCTFCWSGRRDSNPRPSLGNVVGYRRERPVHKGCAVPQGHRFGHKLAGFGQPVPTRPTGSYAVTRSRRCKRGESLAQPRSQRHYAWGVTPSTPARYVDPERLGSRSQRPRSTLRTVCRANASKSASACRSGTSACKATAAMRQPMSLRVSRLAGGIAGTAGRPRRSGPVQSEAESPWRVDGGVGPDGSRPGPPPAPPVAPDAQRHDPRLQPSARRLGQLLRSGVPRRRS